MKPNFSKVSRLQERALLDQLRAARELISHPAEKGRSLEREAMAVIRAMLPAEYGVGSGFIAHHGANGPQLSSQLDVVIFDSVRSGPLGTVESCEVYPIEAVLAYVEVKASICLMTDKAKKLADNSLEKCMETNHELRKIKTRHYWDTNFASTGSPARPDIVTSDNWLSMRAFVFSFETQGAQAKNADLLAQGMANAAKKYDAHLHGVLVLNKCFLSTIPINPRVAPAEDWYHVSYTTENALAAFRLHLLKSLATFQRPADYLIPATDYYFQRSRIWKKAKPTAT